MKKVIIMDVDGTLLNSYKKIPEKTKAELLRVQKEGALLVLASGRPVSGLADLAKELEMDKNQGLLVAFNGSKVVNCQTGETMFDETIPVEDGQAVLEHMKKFDVRPMINKDEYMYVNDVFNNRVHIYGDEVNIIQYESRGGKFKLCEMSDLAEFADYPLNKILTAGEPEYLRAHYTEMMEPFQGELSAMFTAPVYFEFTAKGIDKAKALDYVLTSLGYETDDMIAFGDGENDCSMVAYAGTGVAMGNAVDALKNVADEITLSNEEDGIAQVLKRL